MSHRPAMLILHEQGCSHERIAELLNWARNHKKKFTAELVEAKIGDAKRYADELQAFKTRQERRTAPTTEMLVVDIEFSVRVRNIVTALGLQTVGQVVEWASQDRSTIMKTPNLGARSFAEIMEFRNDPESFIYRG